MAYSFNVIREQKITKEDVYDLVAQLGYCDKGIDDNKRLSYDYHPCDLEKPITLHWLNGSFEAENLETEQEVQRMVEIAIKLGGSLQGNQGEIYNLDGEVTHPPKVKKSKINFFMVYLAVIIVVTYGVIIKKLFF